MSGGTAIRTMYFSHDVNGQMMGESDPDAVYSYTYWDDGRVKAIGVQSVGGSPHLGLFNYYDLEGRRTALIVYLLPAGQADLVNEYSYDNLGDMTRVTQHANGGVPVAPKRVDFAWNLAGEMTSMQRYADVAGTLWVGGTSLSHDLAGRMTNTTQYTALGDDRESWWSYDEKGRVVRAEESFSGNVGTYAYDANDQLTLADNSGRNDESYGYDSNGNRTMSGYSTGGDNRLAAGAAHTYQYDSENNRVRDTAADNTYVEYAWDYRNRLTDLTFKTSGGAITKRVKYSYDELDRRIRKQIDATGDGTYETGERYIYDGDDILMVYNQANVLTTRYVDGPGVDQTLAEETVGTGAVSWLYADREGSVTDTIDNSGNWGQHLVYDSYGKLISGSVGRYGYTGREYDAESGLYYYRARYYDTNVGRFISEDPAGDDTNDFRYVGNNPVTLTDPTGMMAKAVWSGVKQIAPVAGLIMSGLPGIGMLGGTIGGIGTAYSAWSSSGSRSGTPQSGSQLFNSVVTDLGRDVARGRLNVSDLIRPMELQHSFRQTGVGPVLIRGEANYTADGGADLMLTYTMMNGMLQERLGQRTIHINSDAGLSVQQWWNRSAETTEFVNNRIAHEQIYEIQKEMAVGTLLTVGTAGMLGGLGSLARTSTVAATGLRGANVGLAYVSAYGGATSIGQAADRYAVGDMPGTIRSGGMAGLNTIGMAASTWGFFSPIRPGTLSGFPISESIGLDSFGSNAAFMQGEAPGLSLRTMTLNPAGALSGELGAAAYTPGAGLWASVSATWATGSYELVGGHHVHAKRGFEGIATYDPNAAFAVSEGFLRNYGIRHADITGAQQVLFRDFAETGFPNTLTHHSRIAYQALVEAGMPPNVAKDLVLQSQTQLIRSGVLEPSSIPWSGR